jgi:hypothetical protein
MSLSVDQERYYRNILGGDFGGLPPNDIVNLFNITTTQNTVTLSNTPGAVSFPNVYKNNILLQYTTDYTISGTTVTFVNNLVNTDVVIVMYTI